VPIAKRRARVIPNFRVLPKYIRGDKVSTKVADSFLPPTRKADVPFYNFEVRTPSHVMLTEGADLADTTAARVEAARRVGELLRDHAGQLWVDQDWQMDVTNETGLILYVINVSAIRTAATMETNPKH
jgi:hypothetical protein